MSPWDYLRLMERSPAARRSLKGSLSALGGSWGASPGYLGRFLDGWVIVVEFKGFLSVYYLSILLFLSGEEGLGVLGGLGGDFSVMVCITLCFWGSCWFVCVSVYWHGSKL